MAIRVALGAGRSRIIRQLLTESLLFSTLGAALGVLLALWSKNLIHPFLANLPMLHPVRIDGRVLAFTFLVALLTGLLSGMASALAASRLSLSDSLKEGSYGTVPGRLRLRRLSELLVVSEVSLALVLLLGAGLLLKSFIRLRGVDLGFRPDRTLSVTIVLNKSRYPDSRSQAAYFEEVIQRLRKLPGVEMVGINSIMPLGPFAAMAGGLRIEGNPSVSSGEYGLMTSYGVVNADYFRTLGIPLKRGRWFTDQDRAEKPSVLLINESFARRYFANEDPLGKRISGMTIVGVVGDVRHFLTSEPEPQIYHSYLEMGRDFMNLAVRTKGDPMKLAASVGAQIRSVDRAQPFYHLMTLEQRLSDTLAPQRVSMLLASTLAVLAVGLAAAGIYGVLSFSVAQRTHEIGVRMALGAQTRDVLGLVIREGLRLTLAGVILGLMAAFGLTRFLSSLLYGVRAFDLSTFAGVCLFLVSVALLACCLPARRATKVDPMVALRYE